MKISRLPLNILLVGTIIIIGFFAYRKFTKPKDNIPPYKTEKPQKKKIQQNVNTTGILEIKEILKIAADDRQLIRVIAYTIKTNNAEEEQFFEALENAGFEVKTKDLQVFIDGTKKGDWDVGLTVDAITLAGQLDSVVLISGDGDYVPLVEYLRISKGCMVQVVSFSKTTSVKLVEAADDYFDLCIDPKRFLIHFNDSKVNSKKTVRR